MCNSCQTIFIHWCSSSLLLWAAFVSSCGSSLFLPLVVLTTEVLLPLRRNVHLLNNLCRSSVVLLVFTNVFHCFDQFIFGLWDSSFSKISMVKPQRLLNLDFIFVTCFKKILQTGFKFSFNELLSAHKVTQKQITYSQTEQKEKLWRFLSLPCFVGFCWLKFAWCLLHLYPQPSVSLTIWSIKTL